MLQVLRDHGWVEIDDIKKTLKGEIVRSVTIREACPHCAGKIWEVNYAGVICNPEEGLFERITGTIKLEG